MTHRPHIRQLLLILLPVILLVSGLMLAQNTAESAPPYILQPLSGVALSPGYSQSVEAGGIITYTHTLTNTGDTHDTFVLDAASSHDWPVALLGGIYPTGTAHLPLSLDGGVSTTVRVRLSVPTQLMSGTLNIINGAVDRIVITVTSQTSPTVYATATDTATARVMSKAFLSMVVRTGPPPVKLGMDFGSLGDDADVLEYDMPLVREMGASWVRVYLPWLYIETSPGEYDWEPYDAVVHRVDEVGLEPLLLVYGPPAWAAEENCGPISDTLAFEGFLDVVLKRYGSYADAWEFTNEPDGRNPHPWGPTAGCWGNWPDLYAAQLGIFYAKVKSVDPGALVVFGGMAYDVWDYDPNIARDFFTRTLQAGAGQFFDVANVHYYPINPARFPTMAHKVNEISRIMANHGVYGKRIWITETGMWVNLSGSVEQQRDFIVREFARGFGAGLDNIFWFDPREHSVSEDTVQRWLIGLDHQPINGYGTFQHFAHKIAGMSCSGPYWNVPAGIEAYEFTTRGRSLYVLWSNTVTQTVTLPASGSAVLTDRDGIMSYPVPAQDDHVSFEVGIMPVFVEISRTTAEQ